MILALALLLPLHADEPDDTAVEAWQRVVETLEQVAPPALCWAPTDDGVQVYRDCGETLTAYTSAEGPTIADALAGLPDDIEPPDPLALPECEAAE